MCQACSLKSTYPEKHFLWYYYTAILNLSHNNVFILLA